MFFFYPAIKQEQVEDGHKPGASALVIRACVCSVAGWPRSCLPCCAACCLECSVEGERCFELLPLSRMHSGFLLFWPLRWLLEHPLVFTVLSKKSEQAICILQDMDIRRVSYRVLRCDDEGGVSDMPEHLQPNILMLNAVVFKPCHDLSHAARCSTAGSGLTGVSFQCNYCFLSSLRKAKYLFWKNRVRRTMIKEV